MPAGRGRASLLGIRSLAGQVFLLQFVIVLLLIAAAGAVLLLQSRRDGESEARARSLAAADAFARAPGTLQAVESRNPTAVLQPRAEAVRKQTGVDYVVVSNVHGIRLTHPDPARIGQHIVARVGPLLRPQPTTHVLTSAQGLAVDTAVAIRRPDGSYAGLVSVGVTVQRVNSAVNRQLPALLVVGAAALLLTAAGTALVSRRLRRQTHGLAPAELARMYEHHDAVLHAVREGVLIIGADDRLLLVNDEGLRLLDLPRNAEQQRVASLGLEPDTVALLTGEGALTDHVHRAGDRMLAVNKRPTAPFGGLPGSVVTLRDSTELQALAGRAETARERLRLLHDAGTRLGTTLDVTRTAQELADVAVGRFADVVAVDLAEAVLRGDEPTREVPPLRRVALVGLTEDHPLIPLSSLDRAEAAPHARALQRRAGVLEPDLREARKWRRQEPQLVTRLLESGLHSLVTVPLQARGVILGVADFWRRDPREPFDEDDLAFAEELAARAAVSVDNARRYSREHAMAVTLQRRLLPRGAPRQDAVDVAHRYLPARAGVGGDWFDVIPLPGFRVALVVGDVVGHGLHAAATMGRLRTAVYNYTALDMPPDELLSRLGELVTAIDRDESGGGEGAEEEAGLTGATCLYAVYDPVDGCCSVARAGHPGPALVHPDGRVELVDVPVSPPLGVGEPLPVEAAVLRLDVGTRIVLYTDGLVTDRRRDLETGLRALQDALAATGPEATPEETCVHVLHALLPPQPVDDIALLVARTRRLAADQVATWEVPPDPAAVADVRARCSRRLQEWGLEEIAYATELILSELLTNAVRYGSPPIAVRLLRDHTLVVEVSDGSSTSPHLRRAGATDEGGRGLFLVAQFAERWGTRYTPVGKVIWAEQSPHDAAGASGEDLGDALLDQWDDVDL
ncbi:SpoIIE family protein phosphatase [Streptomyces sp. NPDC059740]|uniref:SpoIIE family protein phosphatase n=1 Tax=Streptomyces sp. NPDC059740 TaxID=3346926 RepID=UPI0036601A5D